MEATSKKIKFKKGAASFYMVAIATLVLVIIATSFAAVIIAEIARTSNDDLAQSAYDAAMAGIEDARLAYYNYKSCLEGNGDQGACLKDKLGIEAEDEELHRYVGECNSFAEALGRVRVEPTKEVMVQESNNDNGIGQSYTCVKISMPDDYLFSINGETPLRVVKVKLAEGTDAKDVKSVRVTWGPGVNSDVKVEDIPDLEMSFVQTAMEFKMDDFETTVYDGDGIGKTDRGTVFLDAVGSENASDPGLNETKDWFAKSNDKVASNEKHKIQCNSESNKCQVTIALPEPVAANGLRNPDTFMFVWSLLGGVSGDVDVKMELCTGDDGCDTSGGIAQDTTAPEYESSEDASGRGNAALDMQVSVDSTGRANDLYRRVEVRLENGQMAMQNNMQRIYALAVGNVEKDEATCEANFGVNNCSE